MKSKALSKICVSIAERSAGACIEALHSLESAGMELAEVRLDSMEKNELTDAKLRMIFSSPLRLIATYRTKNNEPDSNPSERESEMLSLLASAIESGAAYVDIEVESSDAHKRALVSEARKKGCTVIISYHDFERTPSDAGLRQIVDWCFDSGADIAKLACMARNNKDSARLLGLLDDGRKLVVIGMGKPGCITRVAAPLLGSPFTFASLKPGKETAEGQLSYKKLAEILERLEHG